MTGFVSSDPLDNLTNTSSRPIFISANRAPTTNDQYPPGTQWQDLSSAAKTIYATTGFAGVWNAGSNAYATTSAAGIVQLSSTILGDAASLTLVPTVKEIKDYVDGIAISGAPAWSETVS